MKKIWLYGLCLLTLAQCVLANTVFNVEAIQVEGLKRIQYGTVLNYLPIQIGQTLQADDTTEIIKALFNTGFFSDVTIKQQGNTLIITVKERPTIGKIEIVGKTSIPKKNLLDSFKGIGLAEGTVFNQSLLDNIRESLQNRLYERGNYDAIVTTHITVMSDNRVAITIQVNEGKIAQVKSIKMTGNHAFSSETLRRQMSLRTSNFWTIISKKNDYSREKLDADLERLHAYYLDRGYLNFKINSAQVAMSANHRYVYITIHITEGAQYHLSGFDVVGETLLPREAIRDHINLNAGTIFSRQKIAEVNRKLGDYLADYGYAFAVIRPIPEIDEEQHTVWIHFTIEPGKKFYVRHINFRGNAKTEDLVLRREMRQEEGAVESLANIRLSERRLNRLGYFKDVQLKTTKVPGIDDQLDLEFSVKEIPSARFTAGAGYSVTQGLMLNAGFNQANFLGTGRSIGLNIQSTEYNKSFNFDYFNPYYTEEGLGRGFNLYANLSDYDSHTEVSNYLMDQYGANMNFVLPISENNTVNFGVGYRHTDLHIGSGASANLKLFAAKYGEDFHNATLSAGWQYNTLDRAYFPTEGYAQQVGALLALPLTQESQAYYKAGYTGRYYLPLYKGFIATVRGEVGYGDGIFKSDELPFYENYYAGGIGIQGAVRGYKGYSIGPKDSQGDVLGGNFLADGTLGLIIPQPLLQDTLRTTVFVDAGNVYTNQQLLRNPFYSCSGEDSGPVRTSVGLAMEWFSPMGLIILSFAKPLNLQPCDNSNVFQFTFGTGI